MARLFEDGLHAFGGKPRGLPQVLPGFLVVAQLPLRPAQEEPGEVVVGVDFEGLEQPVLGAL